MAVIYFRAGYEPDHYPTQGEWDARYLMETSLAIKCPSIQYHLAGTKKVQQALAQPSVLERFINDPEEIKAVGKIFTGLYSLDDNEVGNANYEMALRTPEKFVLKPQREGGGNNVYGVDIPDALKASVGLCLLILEIRLIFIYVAAHVTCRTLCLDSHGSNTSALVEGLHGASGR